MRCLACSLVALLMTLSRTVGAGGDGIATAGEGAEPTLNGSSDDDDACCHRSRARRRTPTRRSAGDASRHLVFHQAVAGVLLRVAKTPTGGIGISR